jgi:hypothetical protein
MWWSLGIGGRFLSPGVGDRPLHEESASRVKERQAAPLRVQTKGFDNLLHSMRRFAPLWTERIHFRRHRVA